MVKREGAIHFSFSIEVPDRKVLWFVLASPASSKLCIMACVEHPQMLSPANSYNLFLKLFQLPAGQSSHIRGKAVSHLIASKYPLCNYFIINPLKMKILIAPIG